MSVTRSAGLRTLGFVLVLAVSVLIEAEQPSSGIPSQATARDPLARTTPAWFDEAKLGIFVHWGASSIPAFAPLGSPRGVTPVTSAEALRAERMRRGTSDPSLNLGKSSWAEIYGRTMLVPGSATARYHAEHYGSMPYEKFVEQFRDEMLPWWNPEPWADLFARAGARYVVLTTRLDDGFLLWPSAHRNPHRDGWQSKRDVVGEFTRAMRARGLRPAFYYAGGIDWTFSGLPMNTTVPQPPDALMKIYRRPYQAGDRLVAQREYVNAHWRELIERYKPDVMWNDYFYPGASVAAPGAERMFDPEFKKHVEDLFRFYVTRVPEGVINNRFDGFWQSSGQIYTDFITPEYSSDPDAGGRRPKGSKLKWEMNRSLGTSYAYNRLESDKNYMSPTELIHLFVDVVARGGNLLINVGPMATGEIPWPQAQRLLELGWWLRTNGGAIYGTRPWEVAEGTTGEGLEVRYTASKVAVFAIVLGAPKTRVVELDLQLDQRVEVGLEGWSGKLKWQMTPAGVRIELPIVPDERPALSLRFSPRTGVQPL